MNQNRTIKKSDLNTLIKPCKGNWNISGNSDVLARPKAAILLSRQAKSLSSDAWWLHAVNKATEWAASNDLAIVAGQGITHLDFVRWAAHQHGHVILVDVGSEKEFAEEKWHDARISLIPENKHDKRELYKFRDKVMAHVADVVIGVALRQGGIMEKIFRELSGSGKKVYVLKPPDKTRQYKGNWNLIDHGVEQLDLDIPVSPGNTKKSEIISLEPPSVGFDAWDEYFWHFTRACPGPWPDQALGDYYRGLLHNEPLAGHSALETLARILQESVIRGCGRMIRGGYEVVSFTSLPPQKILASREYRSALMRWNFEPYGIGIHKELAQEVGIRKVIYGTSDDFKGINEQDKYLFQVKQSGKLEWVGENEWRSLGNIDILKLPRKKCVALVKSEPERKFLECYTGLMVVSLDAFAEL